jgi:hypothetical protein
MANEPAVNQKMNTARLRLKMRSFEADAEVHITSGGLIAVGVLVSAILLSLAPIIHEATRKLPSR